MIKIMPMTTNPPINNQFIQIPPNSLAVALFSIVTVFYCYVRD